MCQLSLSSSLPILLLAINRINSARSYGTRAHFTGWQTGVEEGAAHPLHSPTRVSTPLHASPARLVDSLGKADVQIQACQH